MVNVSTPPPINKLINFGPLIRNKHPHTIPLLLNPQGETETQFYYSLQKVEMFSYLEQLMASW